MIDYARVAQLLKEVDSFIDTADAPRLHSEYVEALTAASALCEAHAAPVDEDALRDDFEEHVLPTWMPRDRFDDGTYKVPDANSRWHAYRVARARSDARAKVAEQEAENTRLRAECERLLSCVNEAEIGWATDNTEKDDEIEMQCEHGVEHGGINMCSKCAERYTVKALSQPADDWRSRTCGECGWKMRGMCRRVMWGETPQWTDQSGLWTQPSYFGDVQDGDAACPAFVAASIAAGKE